MDVWTTKTSEEPVPISFVMNFSRSLFSQWVRSNDEWEDDMDPLKNPLLRQMIEMVPLTVIILQDGQCVALTVDGFYRYPSWTWLEYFTEAQIETYEAALPSGPDSWDVVSCPYGPPSE